MLDSQEQAKAALASASDGVKQLITLATALLGFEVTFAKDLLVRSGGPARVLAELSWGALLLSVGAGIFTIFALTGHLGAQATFDNSKINAGNVRGLALFQIGSFAVGLLLTVAAAHYVLSDMQPAPVTNKTSPCACEVTVHTTAQPPVVLQPPATLSAASCPAQQPRKPHTRKHSPAPSMACP